MKRTVLKRFLLIILFLCFSASLLAGGLLPVGQPEYDFVYSRWHRDGLFSPDYFDYQLGPYRFDPSRRGLGPFGSLDAIGDNRLQLHGFLSEEFAASDEARATGYESFRGGLAARPLDKLFVYADFLLDESLAQDSSYTGKKWRGFAGGVQSAFAYVDLGRFDLIVGRFASFWGPSNSLLLSPGQNLDGFAYTFRFGRLRLSYRLARLDGTVPRLSTGTALFDNRFLAAHRIDMHLSRSLRLGLFEAVLFGGPGRTVELQYLNPLIFLHSEQLNAQTDDNSFLGLDFDWQLMIGAKLYGQLLIDDFQVDKKEQSDQEPDQYGLIIGGYLAEIAAGLDLAAEYSRVTNWTFNQGRERNRFLYRGQPIGAVRGNDYDLTSVRLIRWFGGFRTASVEFSYLRQGEGRIENVWTEPWMSTSGDYSEPFPTGIVERTLTTSLRFKTFAFSLLYFDASLGVNRITNSGHRSDESRSLPFATIRLSSFISRIIDMGQSE